MKKIITLLFGFFLSQFCTGQDYHPFPESNAMWRCVWGASGCYDNNDYADYQYLITGDTLIGAHQYHKLERSGYFACTPPLYPVSGYMGAFRNDVLERRVYYFPADSLEEFLLYDFNLEIGDTIRGYLPEIGYSGYNTAIIYAIDSIEVAGSYRKRWLYNSFGVYWEGFFIEGIGGDKGPLEALVAQLDLNGELHCFEQDDDVVYSTGVLPACELATGIPTDRSLQFSIHPNPVIDQLMISPTGEAADFEIRDLHGKLVSAVALRQLEWTISVADLAAGIYTITLRSSRGIGHARFVKVMQ